MGRDTYVLENQESDLLELTKNSIKWLSGKQDESAIVMAAWTHDRLHGAGTISYGVLPDQVGYKQFLMSMW